MKKSLLILYEVEINFRNDKYISMYIIIFKLMCPLIKITSSFLLCL